MSLDIFFPKRYRNVPVLGVFFLSVIPLEYGTYLVLVGNIDSGGIE